MDDESFEEESHDQYQPGNYGQQQHGQYQPPQGMYGEPKKTVSSRISGATTSAVQGTANIIRAANRPFNNLVGGVVQTFTPQQEPERKPDLFSDEPGQGTPKKSTSQKIVGAINTVNKPVNDLTKWALGGGRKDDEKK